MLADGRRSGVDRIRRVVGRVPAVAVWGVALLFAVRLSHGLIQGPSLAKGYAEGWNYSIASTALGRIAQVTADVGSEVAAGQVLVTLESDQLKARIDRMKAELAQSEANAKAQRDVLEAQVARSEIWLLKAESDQQADQAELAALKDRLERLDKLFEQHLVQASEVETTRRLYQAKQAQVATYERVRTAGRASFATPLTSEGTPVTHKESVQVRLSPFTEQIAIQQAELKEAELQLEELTLRSPVAGVVASVTHRPGEVVSPGTEILNVVATRSGMVRVHVPEQEATAISAGTRATLHHGNWLRGQSLEGTVTSVAPQVTETIDRARWSPHIPMWGRLVLIKVDGTQSFLVGEAFDVRFH